MGAQGKVAMPALCTQKPCCDEQEGADADQAL